MGSWISGMRRVLDPCLMGRKGWVLLGLGKFFCWVSSGSVGLVVGQQWLVCLLLIKSSAIEGMAVIWLPGVMLSWCSRRLWWLGGSWRGCYAGFLRGLDIGAGGFGAVPERSPFLAW